MLSIRFTIFAIILFCSAVHFGCDTGSELFAEESGNQELEYKYVEVDVALMAKLDEMADTDAVVGEPQIKFFADRDPIKRFKSREDYEISVDLTWEQSRLLGEPILIHQSLQRYLRYKHLVPVEELALVNYEGRLIIGDTLYTLAGTSYMKQHVDETAAEVMNLSVFDPSRELKEYLNRLLQDQGVSRLTDAMISHKSAKSSTKEPACNAPNYFAFVGGSDPTRSVRGTHMCVWDFNYPKIKVDPGDTRFTENAPGAVLMWNTAYTTWTGFRRGIARTQFFKYRVVHNGASALDYVRDSDVPQHQRVTVKVMVQTSIGTSTRSGRLVTWASRSRRARRGVGSEHSATWSGVSGLPDEHWVH